MNVVIVFIHIKTFLGPLFNLFACEKGSSLSGEWRENVSTHGM